MIGFETHELKLMWDASPDIVPKLFKQVFMCENNKHKIRFMEANGLLHDDVPAFKDVRHLSKKTALTWNNG
jgi:hypothetical protein